MATLQATFVYLNSFRSGELLALGGNSGVMIYDVRRMAFPGISDANVPVVLSGLSVDR